MSLKIEDQEFTKLNGYNSDNGRQPSIEKIVADQRDFFKSGETFNLSYRKDQLLKLRKALLDDKDIITEAVEKDLGRRQQLTYMYEISSVVVEIDYMLNNLEEWTTPTNVQKTLVTILDTTKIVREPKGVVLIIGPWNYPVNTTLLPLVATLAAGNTAILKPSEIASNTASVLYQVLSKTFDPRYLSVVLGGVQETTNLLEQRFDHIMFTGSSTVGKVVMSAASKYLTPCTLELGGKSPTIVEPDADMEITARRLAWGKWLNCGQTCVAPDYVLCNPETRDRLVTTIVKVLKEFYPPDPKDTPDYNRIINANHFDRLFTILSKSKAKRLYEGGECDRDALFIPPIILAASYDDEVMKNELFGPILPIVTVDSLSEAIEFINSREKPLAAYLFTRDERKVDRFVKETSSGGVCINDVIIHLSVDVLPFGGIGNSGMGRYRGRFGFDEFTHEKSVLKRGFFGDGIASARYPPLTDVKIERLRQLTGVRRVVPPSINRFISALPYLMVGIGIGVVIGALLI